MRTERTACRERRIWSSQIHEPGSLFRAHAGLDLENQENGMIVLDDALFRLLSAFVKA